MEGRGGYAGFNVLEGLSAVSPESKYNKFKEYLLEVVQNEAINYDWSQFYNLFTLRNLDCLLSRMERVEEGCLQMDLLALRPCPTSAIK